MNAEQISGRSLRLVAFLLLPAIPVVVLGVALSMQMRAWTTERATSNAAVSAQLVADLAVRPLLEPEDFSNPSVGNERFDELDGSLAHLIGDEVVRLKIWDDEGRVVYSDDEIAVGKTFPISSELGDALAGEISSEVSLLGDSENETERDFDRLISVYTPLRLDSGESVDGAIEFYLPYDPIGDAIARDTRRTVLTLAGALLLLYLALARVSVDWARSRRRADHKEFEANHDALTGLPNRRMFHSILDEISRRDGDREVAVMFLDLDDFKNVNDTLGHAAGDEMLKAVAGRLEGAVRSEATVARIGGDEFGVVVPGITGPGEPAEIAARLIDCLAAPVRLGSSDVVVRASVGIDVVAAVDLRPDIVQRNADNAMYMAKGAGKACHATFDAEFHEQLHDRVDPQPPASLVAASDRS